MSPVGSRWPHSILGSPQSSASLSPKMTWQLLSRCVLTKSRTNCILGFGFSRTLFFSVMKWVRRTTKLQYSLENRRAARRLITLRLFTKLELTWWSLGSSIRATIRMICGMEFRSSQCLSRYILSEPRIRASHSRLFGEPRPGESIMCNLLDLNSIIPEVPVSRSTGESSLSPNSVFNCVETRPKKQIA